LDSAEWSRRPEFVVFWTNVFDWLGAAGGPEYRGYSVGPLGAGWKRVDGDDGGGEPGLWPGLYERGEDGARRAVNALDIRFPPSDAATRGAAAGDWRAALGRALARVDRGTSLAPAMLVLAVCCVAGSALFWGRLPRRSPAMPAGAAEAAGTGHLV
jgi:hypothetical protein